MGRIDLENSLSYLRGMLLAMKHVVKEAHCGPAVVHVNDFAIQSLTKVLEEVELLERKLNVARSHIDNIYVPKIKELEQQIARYKGEVEELGERLDQYE